MPSTLVKRTNDASKKRKTNDIPGQNAAATPDSVEGNNAVAAPDKVEGNNAPDKVEGNNAAAPDVVEGQNAVTTRDKVEGQNATAAPDEVEGNNAAAPAPEPAADTTTATPPPKRKRTRYYKTNFEWKDTGIDDNDQDRVFCGMIFKLLLFKSRYGHTNVLPSDTEGNGPLGEWVWHLRQKPTKETLQAEQLAVLEQVGFVWNVREETMRQHWNHMYGRLVEYKAIHGTTNIPQKDRTTDGLARWVHVQRHRWNVTKREQQKKKQFRRTKPLQQNELMTDEQKEKLDAIGFQWNVHNHEGWEERFEQLKEYKNQFGNCNVPQHYKENRGLGKWVARQRYNYCQIQQGKFKPGSNDQLDENRLQRLKDLGFNWGRLRPNTWKTKNKQQQKKQPSSSAGQSSSSGKASEAKEKATEKEQVANPESAGTDERLADGILGQESAEELLRNSIFF